MKQYIFIFSFFISSTSLATPLLTSHLLLGEEKKIPLTSARVWIEDSKVLKAQSLGRTLKLTGLAEGGSLVRIGEQQYQIYVIHPKKQESFLRIQEVLKKNLGLKVNYLQGETQVQGHLFRLEDLKNLALQLRGFDVNYQLNVEMSPELKAETQKYFDALLTENSLAKQKVSFSEGITLTCH